MIYAVAALFATAIGMTVALVVQLVATRPRAVARQLAELERSGIAEFDMHRREVRRHRSEQLKALLEWIGGSFGASSASAAAIRQQLIYAGYRDPDAPAVFWGIRLAVPVVLAVLMFFIVTATGGSGVTTLIALGWALALGWVAPAVHVGRRARARQKEITLALPDALDLLVVCVEAGLALNQAIVRVADEIRHVSHLTADEFAMVNLEIRAGIPRADALRNLSERTGVADIQSLVAMLIQTDRFGTSVAQALRVHADTLRTKRRQRAEEAAAKTTIKLVFPLGMCIFPALFVVILGPALVMIYRTLTGIS